MDIQLSGKISRSEIIERPSGDEHVKIGQISKTSTITMDGKTYTYSDISEKINDDTILYRVGEIVYCIPLPVEESVDVNLDNEVIEHNVVNILNNVTIEKGAILNLSNLTIIGGTFR